MADITLGFSKLTSPLLSKLCLIGVSLAMVACAGPAGHAPAPDDWQARQRTRGAALRVIFQACLPESAGNERVIVTVIKNYGYGGGREERTSKTVTEQSVYESFADLPDETRAITVQRSADSPVFLFEPPKRIPNGSWTQWHLPNMQSSSFDYVYQYYYRRDAPHSEPESGAPRVRFTLLSFEDYLARVRRRASRDLVETAPEC